MITDADFRAFMRVMEDTELALDGLEKAHRTITPSWTASRRSVSSPAARWTSSTYGKRHSKRLCRMSIFLLPILPDKRERSLSKQHVSTSVQTVSRLHNRRRMMNEVSEPHPRPRAPRRA